MIITKTEAEVTHTVQLGHQNAALLIITAPYCIWLIILILCCHLKYDNYTIAVLFDHNSSVHLD